MIDVTTLQSVLSSISIGTKEVSVQRLPGDASNRTYYRDSYKKGDASHSLILMALSDAEPFKASEEAVSGTSAPITELPFINIERHLRHCGIAVPEILHADLEKGWILLEDLGDVMISDVVCKNALHSKKVSELYQSAIDTLIQIQRFATPSGGRPTIAHTRAFDQALFVWEFDHFIEYGIEKREGFIIPEKDRQMIRAYFSDIALRLATLPQVFTHRDYHSRNLMVQQAGDAAFTIRVIDFQDALMGPCQYDLASLLRDSYIDLPEEVIDSLIGYYVTQWEEQTGEQIQRELFLEFFDLISIQRNMKAAGRFVFVDQVKKNPKFLPYVAPTLAKVKRNLEKNKRLKPLHDLLAQYVTELN
jgi:aminoglycoside/choline kinase family phosphotransferase